MSEKVKSEKFHKEDLPKIIAAMQEAHTRGEACSVLTVFAADGGMISLTLEAKKKFK